jgi:hypothetical protein
MPKVQIKMNRQAKIIHININTETALQRTKVMAPKLKAIRRDREQAIHIIPQELWTLMGQGQALINKAIITRIIREVKILLILEILEEGQIVAEEVVKQKVLNQEDVQGALSVIPALNPMMRQLLRFNMVSNLQRRTLSKNSK